MSYQLNFGSFQGEFNTLAEVLVAMNGRHEDAIVEVFPLDAEIQLTRNGLESLPVVKNNYGKYGVLQHGTATQIIDAMLDEVDALYVRKNGAVLQPWQIPSSQWNAVNAIGKAAFNVFPCLTAGQLQEKCHYVDKNGASQQCDISWYCSQAFLERFGYGHNGPLYGPNRDSNSRHDVHVAYALAEGKPVPEEVIAEYRDKPKSMDLGEWFKALIDVPAIRGKIAVGHLQDMMVVLRREKGVKLSETTAQFFIDLLAGYPKESQSYVEMDDFLYEKGVIGKLPALDQQPVTAVPVSDLALKIRESIGQKKKADHIKWKTEERSKGRITLRELERELAIAEDLPIRESFEWSNKLATAVQEKNLDILLHVFDTANDWNVASKKAVFEATGLKTLNVKAELRRAAIFAFCGYDDLKRKEYERNKESAAKQRENERLKADIISRVESERVRYNGSIMSAKDYVDQAVAAGYTTITDHAKGCARQYWLYNTNNGHLLSLQTKNGTVDYARVVLGLVETKKAA